MILWLATQAACVVVPDPNHCANKLGDETCSEKGEGWVCSSCTRANDGCVMGQPPEECRETAASGESDTDPATTEPTSTMTSTDTGETPCDPECADPAPYCVAAQCVPCSDAGGDEFCAALDPETPQCHPTWGRCVTCYSPGSPACADDEPFCGDAFECAGCSEHAQCPDSACDLESGRCMDDATQLWVDNAECVEPAMGTAESPYCTLAEAMAVIGAGDVQSVIHLAGGTPYTESAVLTEPCATDRTLAILGFGGTPVLQGDPNVVEVGCGNTLYLSNIRLITGMVAGAYCDAARLWIDDSILVDNEIGVDAVGCRLHVRRTEILRTEGTGIRTDNETDLRLWSSIIGSGGDAGASTRAIQASMGTIDIRFSTIANNAGTSEPSFWCGGNVEGTVRNSIFGSTGGSSVDCPTVELENNALDDEALAMDGSGNVYVLYLDEWFAAPARDDYRLGVEPPPGYLTGGIWQPGDPRVDVDGEPRTDVPGTTVSLGADAR